MTVTDPVASILQARQQLGELAGRVDQALADTVRLPTLDDARAACNEVGIHDARRNLAGSLDLIADAQTAKRGADDELKLLTEAVDAAVLEAEWELDGQFVTEANKTFLVVGDDRRQMTADERKAWKQAHALKHPTVAAALAARRAGESRANEARDALALAERRFSACKANLAAAVAQLETLRAALTTNGAS